MPDTTQLMQFLFSGLTAGSIYALMAVSYGMIYKVSRVISFAQGEFFVFGALAMATFTMKGVPVAIAFALSVLMAAALGALVERLLIRPILASPIGVKITMTIAISFALSGLALLIWGRESYVSVPFSSSEPLTILGASLQIQVVWIIGTTAAVLLALWFLFEKTLSGIAMRACSENPFGASLMGISVGKVTMIAWVFGSALGALAGMVVAPLYFVQYASGTMPMIKGFTAMAIGGLTSLVGSVIAGFCLGIVEAYTIGLVSSQFADVIVFTILILVLLASTWGVWETPDDGGM